MQKQQSFSLLFTCPGCLKPYQNKRALSTHLASSLTCMETIVAKLPYQIMNHTEIKHSILNTTNSKNIATTDSIVEEADSKELTNSESSSSSEEASITQNMEDDNHGYQPYYFSSDEYQEIKLLKLLNDLGTPLYAYKLIMEWAKEAHLSSYSFDSQHTSHKHMISYLQNKLQIKMCQPTIIPVKLMHDNYQADVVVFDVREMLMSLFDSQELNQMDNLVVNSKNIFSKYDPDDNRYGEVNSGTWYGKAYQNCIKKPEEDFLCPIILASDKTTLSDMGDLHVDAIFMTTSIFDIKVSTAFPYIYKIVHV